MGRNDQEIGDYIGSMFPASLLSVATEATLCTMPRHHALTCLQKEPSQPAAALTAALFLYMISRPLPPGRLKSQLLTRGYDFLRVALGLT